MTVTFTKAVEEVKCYTCDNTTKNSIVLTGALQYPICSDCLAALLSEVLSTGLNIPENKASEDNKQFRDSCIYVRQVLNFTQKVLKDQLKASENPDTPQ